MTPSSSAGPARAGVRRLERATGLWQRTRPTARSSTRCRPASAASRSAIILTATNRTEAVKEAQALRVDVARGVVKPTDRKARAADVRDSFVEHLRSRTTSLDRRKRMSARTVALYEQRLGWMVERLPAKIADCEVGHVVRIIERLEADGRAPATVTGYVVALSSMFEYARRSKLISANPVRSLEREDRPGTTPVRTKRFLDARQVEQLLAELTDESRPVAAVMAYGALRVSEVLGLRWADVDLKGGVLQVRGQAGANGERAQAKTVASEQPIPIVPKLAETLRAAPRAGRLGGRPARGAVGRARLRDPLRSAARAAERVPRRRGCRDPGETRQGRPARPAALVPQPGRERRPLARGSAAAREAHERPDDGALHRRRADRRGARQAARGGRGG